MRDKVTSWFSAAPSIQSSFNGAQDRGGQGRESHQRHKNGLPVSAAFDENELKALTESAIVEGCSAVAAEEVARAVLEHRRVMLSYHEVYAQNQAHYADRGHTRRFFIYDFVSAWQVLEDEARPLTDNQALVLEFALGPAEHGYLIVDTTGEYLLGLERYLRRSSSRVLKAVRLS